MHKLLHHPALAPLRKRGASQLGLLALRLAAGAIFVYHGYPKLFGGTAQTVAFFTKLGIPAPEFMAPFVGGVEFFGGLMLMLGLAARLWGLALAFDMAVAIISTKHYMMWKSAEFELILMASSLNFLLTGAGDYSLDAWLMKKSKAEHEAAMPAPMKS